MEGIPTGFSRLRCCAHLRHLTADAMSFAPLFHLLSSRFCCHAILYICQCKLFSHSLMCNPPNTHTHIPALQVQQRDHRGRSHMYTMWQCRTDGSSTAELAVHALVVHVARACRTLGVPVRGHRRQRRPGCAERSRQIRCVRPIVCFMPTIGLGYCY